jgi:hypothetical protein
VQLVLALLAHLALLQVPVGLLLVRYLVLVLQVQLVWDLGYLDPCLFTP